MLSASACVVCRSCRANFFFQVLWFVKLIISLSLSCLLARSLTRTLCIVCRCAELTLPIVLRSLYFFFCLKVLFGNGVFCGWFFFSVHLFRFGTEILLMVHQCIGWIYERFLLAKACLMYVCVCAFYIFFASSPSSPLLASLRHKLQMSCDRKNDWMMIKVKFSTLWLGVFNADTQTLYMYVRVCCVLRT